MMIGIICFTACGYSLAERIKTYWNAAGQQVDIRDGRGQKNGDWVQMQFQKKNALFFIGATGIAVRMIAPYVSDKFTDSPVLVIDDMGQFVIPLLSGHLGGANEIGSELAQELGATFVVTTATDCHGVFAIDLYAKAHHLHIVNREGIATVSGKLLEKRTASVGIIGKEEIPDSLREEKPDELVFVPYSMFAHSEENTPDIVLQTKAYVFGVGCKKGKSFAELKSFCENQCERLDIALTQIRAICSIDVKKAEQGLRELSAWLRVPFVTFSAEELKKVDGIFSSSAFVEQQVGVDNVCERAAMKYTEGNGILVLPKQAENGMSCAVVQMPWG